MNNFNLEGKEFIHGIFTAGQSFGEPPLFARVKYPTNAEAISDCKVIQLHKEKFLELLALNPEVYLEITENLAKGFFTKPLWLLKFPVRSRNTAFFVSYIILKNMYTKRKRNFPIK